MILLPCPHCGPRNASEFRYLGEAPHRPEVATSGPDEWRAYLYLKRNPAGWTTETWLHRAGCRRFLVVERDTVTNEVRSVRDAAGLSSDLGMRIARKPEIGVPGTAGPEVPT